MTQLPLATARLVSDDARLDFLPKHFGPRFMLRGESAIYRWLNRLSADYQGGYWHYYDIPASFYLAPAREEPMRIIWPLNGCDCTVSADAAGVVAMLYAWRELCEFPACHHLVDKYYALLAFADAHPEAGAIQAAID